MNLAAILPLIFIVPMIMVIIIFHLSQVIPQLNRQQRRYDDQKGYTQITVDLDSIEEKEYLDEKKNNFEGSRREVQATVFEFEPRQDYIIAERTENNLNGGRHDTDDR